MATVALRVGGNVLGRLASGGGAVMAARAGAGDIGVIESAGAPGDGVMTIFTRFGSRNVGIRLAYRIHIVVAALATAGNVGMIEPHAAPVLIRYVAIVTRCRSLDMVRRFTRGSHPVMAAFTGSGDDRVIEIDLGPTGGRGMAAFAGGGGRHV